MSLYAMLIDRKMAQSGEERDALPIFDDAPAILKAEYPDVSDISWGELKDGQELGCYIGGTRDLQVFAVCLAIKGKDDIPPQVGKQRALYNEFASQVKRWPHLVGGGAHSGCFYLPTRFDTPKSWDRNILCSSDQLLTELDELQPFIEYPPEYADLRGEGWQRFQADVQRVEEMEDWSGEWAAWACLYWLAKLSVQHKLLVIFH